MNVLIFSIGFIIFVTYMFFLVRMINQQHKKQEQEQGKINYKKQVNMKPPRIQRIRKVQVKKEIKL